MKIKFVIKQWNGANDYWSYYKETPDNIQSFDHAQNRFIGGTIDKAKKFDTASEALKALEAFEMTSSYYKIELIYVPGIKG